MVSNAMIVFFIVVSFLLSFSAQLREAGYINKSLSTLGNVCLFSHLIAFLFRMNYRITTFYCVSHDV